MALCPITLAHRRLLVECFEAARDLLEGPLWEYPVSIRDSLLGET